MDSLITAAAHALAAGDPLGALKRVALRDDAPALALRGVALAQLGDFPRAKALLRSATRAFGVHEPHAHARCIVAEAEVAFASRDLGWSPKALEQARLTLVRLGDVVNAAHATQLAARRLMLLGRLDDATRALDALDDERLPPALRAVQALTRAGIAMRRVQSATAYASLRGAAQAAHASRIPALIAEVARAQQIFDAPVARMHGTANDRVLRLADVDALFASDALVVDACNRRVRQSTQVVSLATRPVLFALARALGEAWPNDVPRDALIARAFGSALTDDSHRQRLRVEIARLRAAVAQLVEVQATTRGFMFVVAPPQEVVVMVPADDQPHAAVLALLADGEAWSTSALALALDESQRTIQRALSQLAGAGAAQSFGNGRARRWITSPLAGFATHLSLTAPLPGG